MATQAQAVEKLGEMVREIGFAMLTTVDEEGCLRSRPMATQDYKKHPFDGVLWFFTKEHSPKAEEVARERQVNLAYADAGHNRYVSVSGVARVVKDRKIAEELWSPLYKAWFPGGLDDPELSLLRVTVEKAEYWDPGSSKIVQLAGFVKAMVTGKEYRPGENEKLEFKSAVQAEASAKSNVRG